MAGLRLGYSLCADQELNIRLETVRQPWSVSGPAQRAGIAALKERDYLEATKRLIGPERERMKGKLVELGFQVYPSQANYIFSEILSGRKGIPFMTDCCAGAC